MSTLGDIAKLLEQIPLWKQLKSLPMRVAELEARVAALDDEIKKRPAAEHCPICGTGTMKVRNVYNHPQLGRVGVKMHEVNCDNPECGHEDERVHDPLGRMGKK